MRRPRLEVADIFQRHGAAWRRANAGHVSLGQLQVMSAIKNCRSAVLGGHVERCEDCDHSRIAYNSCRNRHCPKCQGAAARDWLAARAADLLPVGYFHLPRRHCPRRHMQFSRCDPRRLMSTLWVGPADHDEFLAVQALDLEPGPAVRLIATINPLRDDPFKAVLAGDLVERRPMVDLMVAVADRP